jgi:MerR family transcriptional regulator, copper efflux regulator
MDRLRFMVQLSDTFNLFHLQVQTNHAAISRSLELNMYIGELSKLSGASRKAIYLYEQMGLIEKPARRGSYRIYPPTTVDRIQTIRCAQSLGFKLKELVDAVASNGKNPVSSLAHMLEQIRMKRLSIQLQIEAAQAQLKLLNQFENELRNSPGLVNCELPVDSSPRGKL